MAAPKRHLSLLRSFTPADVLTIGNASCGTIAIFLCLDGVSRLARFNVTADELADATTGKVKYFEGTPIPTSILIVLMWGLACATGRIDAQLWFGAHQAGPAVLHPLSLIYAASGSAMISATLRVPKP